MKNKISYIAPQIEIIVLDNEISLALESIPPFGPEETLHQHSPEHFNTNSYKA